jgi:N-acetylglutamate synthase-like GNAT family acetyltransferase
MQIRVANRQDEPILRTIINQANAEVGDSEIELTGRDSDLTNIDSQYFWFDGIFIVAEDDGQIVGLAGARRGESDDVLRLIRLVVVPARRKTGCAALLMDTIVFFARNAEYKRIEYTPRKSDPAEPFLGFTADGGMWLREVEGAAQSCSSR